MLSLVRIVKSVKLISDDDDALDKISKVRVNAPESVRLMNDVNNNWIW